MRHKASYGTEISSCWRGSDSAEHITAPSTEMDVALQELKEDRAGGYYSAFKYLLAYVVPPLNSL